MAYAAHILAMVEDALSECFEYHDQLDAFVTRSGISAGLLQVSRDAAEERRKSSSRTFLRAPKRYVAQALLGELNALGEDGDRLISNIITSLSRGQFPKASPTGKTAVASLQKWAEEDRQAKEAERRAREIEAAQREAARMTPKERRAEAAATSREELRVDFEALCAQTDPQARGYALERFLPRLLVLEGLNPRGSFKIIGEQIDGSFAWQGSTHLIEARWRNEQEGGAAFGGFLFKLDGKAIDTRGLFLSINGFSEPALTALKRKGAARFVCIDGAHLMRALLPGVTLPAVLSAVWRHAGETGEAYLPAARMMLR